MPVSREQCIACLHALFQKSIGRPAPAWVLRQALRICRGEAVECAAQRCRSVTRSASLLLHRSCYTSTNSSVNEGYQPDTSPFVSCDDTILDAAQRVGVSLRPSCMKAAEGDNNNDNNNSQNDQSETISTSTYRLDWLLDFLFEVEAEERRQGEHQGRAATAASPDSAEDATTSASAPSLNTTAPATTPTLLRQLGGPCETLAVTRDDVHTRILLS